MTINNSNNNGEKTYLRLTVKDIKEQVAEISAQVKAIEIQLAKLSSINYENMSNSINELMRDVSGLKVKAGIWGLIGGILSTLTIAVIYLLLKGTK